MDGAKLHEVRQKPKILSTGKDCLMAPAVYSPTVLGLGRGREEGGGASARSVGVAVRWIDCPK